ncbi:MAG TPA: hypothetical protein EYP05_02835 [Piscirickettsiaceae bacterium]|nr:hypothetical protein [Piscirickettsiaceae bacterium]
MKRRVLLGLLALVPLGGCGWHLRGSTVDLSTAIQAIALEDQGVDEGIYRALTLRLQSAGVVVTPAAELRLVLAPTRWHINRAQVTLTGDTAAELMSLKQPFSVWRAGVRLLVDEVVVYRDHQIDTAALAAAEAQRRSLRAQMRREAAEQILRQLSFLP